MTYRAELNKKTSFQLYRMLTKCRKWWGALDATDELLYETVSNNESDDESHKDALVDLVDRMHTAGKL